MNRIAQLTLLLALCAGTAHADEAAGKRVLDGLTGFNEKLTGSHQLGVYIGTQNIGTYHVTIDKAPENSGGTYRLTEKVNMKLGPNQFLTEKVAILNARFALVQATETRVEVKDGKREETRQVTRTTSGGSQLARIWRRGDQRKVFRIKRAPGEQDDGAALLVQVIALKPGTYTFNSVDWPDPDKGEAEAKWVKLSFEVREAKELDHRGKTTRVVRITQKKGEEKPDELFVNTAGHLLSAQFAGTPIKIVAGTAEEIGKDLPKPKTQ